MGFYFRKSFKAGPARINISKRGVGWSVGTKGFRFGHRAGSGRRKSSSSSSEKSVVRFFLKLTLFIVAVVAIVFAVSLIIALIKEFWPWLVGAAAVVVAAFVGLKIFQLRKAVNGPVKDPVIDE